MAHNTPGMVDLGESLGQPTLASSKSSRKLYPSISLDPSAHPALASVEVGDRCTLLADGEVTSISKRRTADGNGEQSVSIELRVGKVTPDTDAGYGEAKYCPKCGYSTRGKNVFCPECGARLDKMPGKKAAEEEE